MTDSKEKFLGKEIDIRNDFPSASYAEWKSQVEKDLSKGSPNPKDGIFEKKLLTKTYEGIVLKPIYTSEDVKDFPNNELPGFRHFSRCSRSSGYITNDWDIAQSIKLSDSSDYNKVLRDALNRGQKCLVISLDNATKTGLDADYAPSEVVGDEGISLSAVPSLERLFEDIDITKYPVYVDAGFSPLPFIILLNSYLAKKNIKLSALKGAITSDMFSELLSQGSLPIKIDDLFEELEIVNKTLMKNSCNLRTIGINGYKYVDFGASAVQELAFTISSANEYLNRFVNNNYSLTDYLKRFQFNLGIGPNYFMEIAKFRAARILWSNLQKAYDIDTEIQSIFLHARTTNYNFSVLDPYVNMLRGTTETFSAIVGGADSIETLPFDFLTEHYNEFSARIARNTQIILKEESHLNELIDPAGGSYYIETLTKEIAKSAWELFKEIEDEGGFFESVKKGLIQEKILETASIKEKDYAKRKSVLVGTNMYANTKEPKAEFDNFNHQKLKRKRSEYLQKYRTEGKTENHSNIIEKLNKIADTDFSDVIFSGAEAIMEGATIGEVIKIIRSRNDNSVVVKPLKTKRAALPFENLRSIANEINNLRGYSPKIFLATMGTVKEFKGRADFSRAFFETGGFEVIYPKGFESAVIAVNEAVESKSDIIVLCSLDEKYTEIVPEFCENVKKRNLSTKLILAGFPKEKINDYKNAGIDDFIYLGCDVYNILFAQLDNILNTSSRSAR